MSVSTSQSQNISSTSLYVGDLHSLVAETFLYTTFSEYGPVVSARICRDVSSNVSLKYGYVNFENPKDAENAINNLNYAELYGQQIRIMWSQNQIDEQAVGIRGLVSGTMPPNMATAPMNNFPNLMPQVSGLIHQQYVTARPNSQHMLNGSHGISQRTAMVAAARIRPLLSNQTLRLMQPSMTGPSSAVPFNHSARNLSTFKPMPSRDYFMQMNIKEILKLPVEDQRQHFGEIIFLKIHKTHPSMSRKFTGMFIGMDIPDLRKMVESDDFLNNKISEAIQVLKLQNYHADHANKMDTNSNSTRQTEDSLENVISALDNKQLSEVKTE